MLFLIASTVTKFAHLESPIDTLIFSISIEILESLDEVVV